MRIGEGTQSVEQERCASEKANAARERKRKGRGRQTLSARGKNPPRLPPLDLWIQGAVLSGVHSPHALTAGKNLSR
jgi:ribosomal protein L19E